MTAWISLFAQQSSPNAAAGATAGMIILIFYFALIALAIAGVWMTFTKAGKPGWASIVPIYNIIVLLEIAGKPIWWFLLLFIPIVNIVISIIVSLEVAKAFGKGAGFGIGIAFLPFIFYPILGFGSARYYGPAAA